jgi:transcriptional regulator with XRE-family HTH domain
MDKLKAVRTSLRRGEFSQVEIARKAEIAQGTVSNMMRDDRSPTYESVDKAHTAILRLRETRKKAQAAKAKRAAAKVARGGAAA